MFNVTDQFHSVLNETFYESNWKRNYQIFKEHSASNKITFSSEVHLWFYNNKQIKLTEQEIQKAKIIF